MALTKAQFRNRCKEIAIEERQVADIGPIRIRKVSKAAFDKLRAENDKLANGEKAKSDERFGTAFVAACILDDEGNAMFEDAEQVAEIPLILLKRLSEAVLDVNGVKSADVIAKNSAATQMTASASA